MPRCRACSEYVDAGQIDAVLVTHAHPDHCADLSPLLRARALRPDPPAPLPCYSLPGALDAVLALDARIIARTRPAAVNEFSAGDRFPVGPFIVDTRALPHTLPNAGFRLSVDGSVLAYTGDNGPDPAVVEFADGADLFIAEATYVESVWIRATSACSAARPTPDARPSRPEPPASS